jgi:hypothetical protein
MTMEEQLLIAGRRMLDKTKAGLQGPAGFLSEARLEAYLEKLDPARGVSDPARGVSRENENRSHENGYENRSHTVFRSGNRTITIMRIVLDPPPAPLPLAGDGWRWLAMAGDGLDEAH